MGRDRTNNARIDELALAVPSTDCLGLGRAGAWSTPQLPSKPIDLVAASIKDLTAAAATTTATSASHRHAFDWCDIPATTTTTSLTTACTFIDAIECLISITHIAARFIELDPTNAATIDGFVPTDIVSDPQHVLWPATARHGSTLSALAWLHHLCSSTYKLITHPHYVGLRCSNCLSAVPELSTTIRLYVLANQPHAQHTWRRHVVVLVLCAIFEQLFDRTRCELEFAHLERQRG